MYFLTLLTCLSATVYEPWFPDSFLPIFEASYSYDNFNELDRAGRVLPYNSDTHFISGSLTLSPLGYICAELETKGGLNHRNRHLYDDTRLTFRFLMMNDILGDPVSLTTGVTVGFVSADHFRDISNFHSGRFEYEGHIAAGREVSCGPFWHFHGWGVLGIGMANHSAPWVFSSLNFAHNHLDLVSGRLSLEGLIGLGDHRLNPNDFSGYGVIRHRSLNVTGAVTLCDKYTLTYTQRLIARNFPENQKRITLSYKVF